MNTQFPMHLNRQKVSDALIALQGSPSRSGKTSFTSDLRKRGFHPDTWYPLARSRDLKKGKMLGVPFAGIPMMVVRTVGGMVYALEDRCAPRQILLRGGAWRVCAVWASFLNIWPDRVMQGVPYSEKAQLRPTGFRNFPCRKAYGLVLVFLGRVSRVNEIGFPDWSLSDDP